MITANSYDNSKPNLVKSEFVAIATKQAEKLYIILTKDNNKLTNGWNDDAQIYLNIDQ